MRKLIVLEHISLDGVIQTPGGGQEDTSSGFMLGGWIAPYADAVLTTALRRQMSAHFDLLLGRKTFDIWAPYWPNHGDIWPQANAATKYIASHTQKASNWQSSVFLDRMLPIKSPKSNHKMGQTCTCGEAVISFKPC